jgi:hypothetical protein
VPISYFRIAQHRADDSVVSSALRSLLIPVQNILVYPNPTNHKMMLHWPDAPSKASLLKVFLSDGRIVHQGFLPAGQAQQELFLSDCGMTAAGLYHLQIRMANGQREMVKVVLS